MADQLKPRRSFVKQAGVAITSAALTGLPTSYAAADNNPLSKPARRDVRAFGAKGDGKNLDTPAINRAIETASNAGGGTVLFPAGTYLCYSIHLKSNVALELSQGATILAAE